ncbi:response regulator [Phormidesmis priestleyi]
MTFRPHHQPLQVLLVEDNPGDVRLTQMAMARSKLLINLSVVGDGVEALEFLYQRPPYTETPQVDLILLDLNLPRKDGWEVLTEIKADRTLRSIPVVVLTTSQAEEDILSAYQNFANCFITKPVDFNQFVKTVQSIEDFWFTIVKLPPERNP